MRQEWAMPGGSRVCCGKPGLAVSSAWGDLSTFMGYCVSLGHLESVRGASEIYEPKRWEQESG